MPRRIDQTEANLQKDVDMLAGIIGERNSRRPAAIVAARNYIKRRLTETGLDVIEQHYKNVPTRDAVNLEVRLRQID